MPATQHIPGSSSSSDGASTPSPIGKRLTQLLQRQDIAIADLAARTGVSTAMLAKIVEGSRHPTVDILWKIVNALGIRLTSLLSFGYQRDFALTRSADTPRFGSRDGGFMSRALSPFQCGRPFEFYGVELAPGAQQQFAAHPPRTYENLTVHAGQVELIVGRDPPKLLRAGDWTQFQADVPHRYRNLGAEPASLYLVVYYEPSG